MRNNKQKPAHGNEKNPMPPENETLIIPSKDVQSAFATIVDTMFDEIQTLGQTNENLRKNRDLLLPKLISGELDVSELDIDTGEEAS